MINNTSILADGFFEKGKLDDCPILDFHAHMDIFEGGRMPRPSPEEMMVTMDRAGSLLACFCSHNALCVPALDRDFDLNIAKKYPDRFKAYRIVSSNNLDPQKDLKRVDENREHYVGFKFHADFYSVPLSDPRHNPYWEYADDNKLLILCHTWGGSRYDGAGEVCKILDKYKNIAFIAGHCFHKSWREAVETALKYPNLYLELTALHDDRGPLDLFVQKLGSERILFGTDLPWFSTHHGIGAVLSANMTDEDRRNIFYRNGVKLLSRFPQLKERFGALI